MLALVLPFASLALAALASRQFAASHPAAPVLLTPEDVDHDPADVFIPREKDIGRRVEFRVRGSTFVGRVNDFDRTSARTWVDVEVVHDPAVLNTGRVLRLSPDQVHGPPPIEGFRDVVEDVQAFPLKTKLAVVAVVVVAGAMVLHAASAPARRRA